MRRIVMTGRFQGGVALIEAMIALVVVSVVFVAMAGLQTRSLLTFNSSSLRSKATSAMATMTDRVRANSAGYRAGHYNDLTASASNPACIGTNAGCTAAQVAETDYFFWRTELASVLPAGTGIVCVDSTPDDGTPTAPACDGVAAGGRLTLKVWWANKEMGTNNRQVSTFSP